MTSRDFIICMVLMVALIAVTGCKTTPVVVLAPTNSVPIKAVAAPPMPPMPTLGAVNRDTLAIIQPRAPSNTVVALVWSNASYSSPTDFFYYDAQQSSDFTNWSDCGPWWFADIHLTVMLVTNTNSFMFFRLKAIPVLPIVPPYSQYPLAVINNGQGTTWLQQTFANELASTRNVLVMK